jgi:hypothetical protein
MELTVQGIKRMLNNNAPVGSWFDVGRVDRLEWRVGPDNLAVLAVEWAYAKDEWTLRILRKAVLKKDTNERYIWAEVARQRIHAASENTDTAGWLMKLENEMTAARTITPVQMRVPATQPRTLQAVDPLAIIDAREGRR